ncbi:2-oxo acid dehydrogenase subunit E2 [Aliiroseovarius sp. F47248L]|uniref:2-oxo acid dehydrogenase subunit E2 n=1 Tax=Aliiroseovarius sp. F47248L TaxID=2926420 RepID=UPI001FF23AB2|nr:2-oxo acid dehydrogenase subunit E2 [Aliiroseovarius sp. F47248L]MCK0139866.1 2-oxo acid dehydrogenase subunit E2 [Aliiroseovarius sp. F47248L]
MSDGVRTVPLKGVRGMIADAMVKSLATAAQLTHHGSADASALLAEKARLTEAGTKVSVEDLLMLSVARALKKNPDANGRVEGKEVKLHDAIDLSVAIALPGNLLVAPALFGAGDMDVTELRAARQDLAARAKINKLSVTETTGGTFTVTNLGLTRVEHFTPILNAGQICILGIGRMTDRAVRSDDGGIELRPHMGLSLTFDHRALDGAPAGDLLTTICEEIEGMAV